MQVRLAGRKHHAAGEPGEAGADDQQRQGDSYVFRTAEVAQIAAVLQNIIDKDWVLIDLSVRQSALEDMYVKLMDGTAE